jgi:hypothetical protein
MAGSDASIHSLPDSVPVPRKQKIGMEQFVKVIVLVRLQGSNCQVIFYERGDMRNDDGRGPHLNHPAKLT